MIVVYRTNDRAVFLYDFAKNERENIAPDELEDLRLIASRVLAADKVGLDRIVAQEGFQEIAVTTTTKPSRLREAIVETAEAMHRAALMNEADYRKITLRQLGPDAPPTADPISGEEIRSVREQAHLSQAALARYLGLTAGYVSQLERGNKQAKGPALALLNVIRRKGVDVLL